MLLHLECTRQVKYIINIWWVSRLWCQLGGLLDTINVDHWCQLGGFLQHHWCWSLMPCISPLHWSHLSGENRRLLTNELVEFEKWPVEVRDFRRITDCFRGIHRLYLKCMKSKTRRCQHVKPVGCRRLYMPKKLTSRALTGPTLVPSDSTLFYTRSPDFLISRHWFL